HRHPAHRVVGRLRELLPAEDVLRQPLLAYDPPLHRTPSGSDSSTVPLACRPSSLLADSRTDRTRSPSTVRSASTCPMKRSVVPGVAGAPRRMRIACSRASLPAQSVT